MQPGSESLHEGGDLLQTLLFPNKSQKVPIITSICTTVKEQL